MITLNQLKENKEIRTYIAQANEHLKAMGYTEHGFRHVDLVATTAGKILEELNYPKRDKELALMAGYLHDIGNVISRHDHGQSGALLSYSILDKLGMEPQEIALIISAIGNHEEQYGHAVNHVAASLILADKSDVHRSRVRNKDISTFDIHDRVNYGAEHSSLVINSEKKTITMVVNIDLTITTVMEYFEIFLTRMVMCRRAANFLKCDFGLIINESRLL
ncbi:MAG: phosphohydrolase [Desulfitibacter sp. BRH_c19]|nr:MAG: phosphohydrolase [Desulfitibacter sp. BRH_c19]